MISQRPSVVGKHTSSIELENHLVLTDCPVDVTALHGLQRGTGMRADSCCVRFLRG
jgi:hypothetical protein